VTGRRNCGTCNWGRVSACRRGVPGARHPSPNAEPLCERGLDRDGQAWWAHIREPPRDRGLLGSAGTGGGPDAGRRGEAGPTPWRDRDDHAGGRVTQERDDAGGPAIHPGAGCNVKPRQPARHSYKSKSRGSTFPTPPMVRVPPDGYRRRDLWIVDCPFCVRAHVHRGAPGVRRATCRLGRYVVGAIA
jgi:hypothetical protein